MSVYTSTLTLKGAPPEGLNPLPRFRRATGISIHETKGDFPQEAAENIGGQTRTLPYRMQDRYPAELRTVTLKTVVLENRFLKAVFTPEYGGKLWSLYDKENGRELLLANSILRPRNLAIRNAWTAGGIEWNFGSMGHTVFSCDDVFAAVLRDGDGNEFLRIYEFERSKECVWQADFHLPEDSRVLLSHVKLTNPNNEDSTTYWWTNIAVPEDGHTRVLSSSQHVIALCGRTLTYEKLPYLSVMPGDMSYPVNATRSFDYFFQPESDVKTAWECAVDNGGFTFYDRSTAPLIYHKMFCWGNHYGGQRWQDYLSEPGKGYYIEIQAGIAQSQLHDKLFPAGGVFEWTQCFGSTIVDPAKIHDVSLDEADRFMDVEIERLIGEEELLAFNEKYKKAAEIVPEERNVVHAASGWGALELRREAKTGDSRLPSSLCFPESTLGKEQEQWLELLESGLLTAPDPGEIPPSWMVSQKWAALLEKSFDRPGGRNWFSLLHYGNMLFEYMPDNVVAAVSAKWPYSERSRYESMAEDMWKESDMLCPNVWARRNLAYLEYLRDNEDKAFEYYRSVFELEASHSDFAFCAEFMGWLNHSGKYAESWALYGSMPDNLQTEDRVALCAAGCAVKLGYLDFAEKVILAEHSTIREGENSLTDMWFELCARKRAKENGLDPAAVDKDTLSKLKEEAEDNCPPPYSIDFRMSYDKKRQYRASE
ncbi:MAG: DUF5107 domain-containing protein [Clostridia bacterium]|nr:DUF5107 domain-containing protein [Clostridia bacterium]